MNKIVLLISLIVSVTINAQIPANYYNTANGLSGYTLKSQLRTIISNGHINHGYNNLYNGYITTDTDNYYENDGTVLDIYSENPNGTDPYNYTHNNNKCGSYSNEGDCYNREHLMPQSWFNSAQPMKSDIHHVVPSDGKVNGQRGNYPLADVSSASWTSQNGSKRGACADAGYGGTVFEPIDEFKGDVARIYFYMATRYENEIGSWQGANASSNAVLDGSSDHVFENWYFDVLYQWHIQDPVSQREIDRNNAAYDYQGNANPFISHPEWVNAIWNPIPDTEVPSTPTNLNYANLADVSVDLMWTASTDNTGVAGYEIYKDGSLIGSSPTNSFSVANLAANTSYSFYVKAYDASQNFSGISNTINVTTLNAFIFLVDDNFDNCGTTSAFVPFSEASTNNWTCSNQYGENNSACIQMNGYQDDVASKDWLITDNAINFSQYSNEKLSVYLIHKYGSMSLDLLYSTNYDGVGNPVNYTWTAMPNITIDTHDGSSTEVIQVISNADISSLTQDAYVAFRYYVNAAGPTRWTVDSFKISAQNTANISDMAFRSSISLYPNPMNDELTIKSDSTIDYISIYNLLGELILDKNKTNTLDVSELNSGVYLIKIVNQFNQIAFKKIIKE